MDFLFKQINDIRIYGFKSFKKKIFLLIKYFIKLPLYLYGFIICLFLIFIKPLLKVKIQQIPTQNFGDLIILTSLYYLKKKILKKKEYRSLDFLFIDKKNFKLNSQVFKILSKKVKIYSKIFIKPIFEVSNMFSIFESLQIPIFSNRLEYDEDNLFEKHKIFDLTKYEQLRAEEILKKKFGIKKSDKLVFLAIRDSKFTKIKSSSFNSDLTHNSFRDYDVTNFIEASEFLADRGFYVFRMGRSVEKKFSSNNPKLIDYANSDIRSDLLDVYIASKCEFCVSTGFGLDALPYVFGKPMAIISVPVGDFRAHSNRIFFSTKQHYDLNLKRNLSLREIFKKNLAFSMKMSDFVNSQINLIEPNHIEIKDFVKEFYQNIYLKKLFKSEEEKNQILFKKKYLEYFNQSNYTLNKKKYYKNLHKNFNSFFSISFLNKNKNWLN